jgi:phosphatidylinositol glycan class N
MIGPLFSLRECRMLQICLYQRTKEAKPCSADHGMSNIGNHGDGRKYGLDPKTWASAYSPTSRTVADPDSTRTPFVAWGSGVRGPVPDPDSTSHDEVSRPWQFDHLVRRDVDQVDLTMLMAALSGTSWPKNSVGILPDDLLMPVSDPEHIQADLMLGNARSILEQFGTKHSAFEALLKMTAHPR